MSYSFLEPIKIGNLEIKNRVIFLAMAKFMSSPSGLAWHRDVSYLKAVVDGGAGLVLPGAVQVDPDWPSTAPMTLRGDHDMYIPGLSRLVETAHEGGAKIFFQLWHPGQVAYTPGKVPPTINDIDVAELERIKARFVSAAKRVQMTGADGIEIQICHNYLLEQFVSPLFNKRTDEYGWDKVENRLRYPMEIIKAVKEASGGLPISVKLQAYDGVEGGLTLEQSVEMAPYIEKAGADLIVVSAGGTLTDPSFMAGDSTKEEGWKVQAAEAIKAVVTIPVCGTGSIRRPNYASKVIEDGSVDMIGMGRGLLADPEWVKKAEEGREDEIRRCMNCFNCMNLNFMPGTSGCSVNPFAMRETEAGVLIEDGEGRVVAVVGAGPSGLEAAVTLAERGFKPIVFDKHDAIGGMMRLAMRPPTKHRMGWSIDYYKARIKKLGVEVRLKTEVTEEVIEALDPYAVLIATGGRPAELPIPGIDKPMVHHAHEVLEDMAEAQDKKIVVVGSGLTGIETALYYKDQGNDLTLVDVIPQPDFSHAGLPGQPSAEMALEYGRSSYHGIDFLYSHKVASINDDSIELMHTETNEKKKLDADMVIMAAGVKPNEELYLALKGKRPNVYRSGDAIRPGKVFWAVMTGSKFAHALR